jgi:hypothetical protein
VDLVRELTEVNADAIWTARDDDPPLDFGAVLVVPGDDKAPVAWARILLPNSHSRQYGSDARCAYLVLYIEPRADAGTPAPPASLAAWHRRLSQALRLPTAVAAFLANDLGLTTADDPPAEIGVWLMAPSNLRELVEVDFFEVVPGSPQSNGFMGFAVADLDGDQAPEVAVALLRRMCDSGLHLDGHDEALISLARPQDGTGRFKIAVLSTDWSRINWMYGVTLSIEISNTTDSAIRVGAIEVATFWPVIDPVSQPDSSDLDPMDADSLVELRRQECYSPVLAGPLTVPPDDSVVTRVTKMLPRPNMALPGTPEMRILVREAVGSEYVTLIASTDSTPTDVTASLRQGNPDQDPDLEC